MVGTVRRLAAGTGAVEWLDPDHGTWHAAVYHDDIRDGLIARASALGTYRYPHGVGTLPNDVTAYKAEQRDWGADRAHWPPILYQYEATKPVPRTPRPDRWKTDAGELILDIVNDPLLDYADLPHTISSCEKPAFLEAWFRLNSRITMKDIRGRMLQDPKGDWDGGVDPIRGGTLGMRMTRLRETHGMISWRKKKGSDQIKTYLDSILPQACKDANSIKGFRQLHPHEKYALHLGNIGQFPERSRAGAKDLSDEKKTTVNKEARARYESLKAAFEAKQAASTSESSSASGTGSEDDSSEPDSEDDEDAEDALRNLDLGQDDNTSGTQSRGKADTDDDEAGPHASDSESANEDDEGESIIDDVDAPGSDDDSGFLELDAETQAHRDLLHQLLEPSRRQFASLTGGPPAPTTPTASYNEQWWELQAALEEHWTAAGSQGEAPELLGLLRLTRAVILWNSQTEIPRLSGDTIVRIAQLLAGFD